MSCLLAVTTDLPARRALRSQDSTGLRPPMSSMTTSTLELRMSLMSSVQRAVEGTKRAASEARLRSTLRLKTWVSSMFGNLDCASTLATEPPTVPKPSSATLRMGLAVDAAVFFAEARFPAVDFFWAFFWAMAMLVVDSFCLIAPGLKAGDG